MRLFLNLLVFISLSLFQIVSCYAQLEVSSGNEFEQMLEKAKEYYYNGEYEKTIQELERAMAYISEIEKSDRVEAYKYLGFSYVAFGKSERAKLAFKKALELEPNLELDPALVSPKIIKIFEQLKAEMSIKPEPVKPEKELEKIEEMEVVEVKKAPIAVKKATMWAFTRSFVIPGWGQFYKGEPVKGCFIIGIETVSAGGLILAHLACIRAHDKYLKAQSVDEIQSAYDRYNSMYKLRDAMLGITGIVWVYNLVDIFISHSRYTKVGSTQPYNTEQMGFYIKVDKNQISLLYCFKL